jgi:nucleotide-binding universal stress UspA family protein
MLSKIMVPLDGSPLAERALPCATSVAAATGATVLLVRVTEPAITVGAVAPPALVGTTTRGLAAPAALYLRDTPDSGATAVRRAAAEAYLEATRYRLVRCTPITVETETLIGDAAANLLESERSDGIDLVVMCSHGRGGLARMALGSVADQLLHYGTTPLLLVRGFGDDLSLQQAIVPLDGSPHAEQVLPVLQELVPALVQDVTLLRVIDKEEERPGAEFYLAGIAQQLPRIGVSWHYEVVEGDPAQAIVAVAGLHGLVVMATHGRSGLARWALGSVADRVAHGGVAGVLLVRAAGR